MPPSFLSKTLAILTATQGYRNPFLGHILAEGSHGSRPSHAARVGKAVVSDGGTNRRLGGEESFLDPNPKDHSIDEVMRAEGDGELFLFVNDAVLGVPGLEGLFYSNNVGNADVTIDRR